MGYERQNSSSALKTSLRFTERQRLEGALLACRGGFLVTAKLDRWSVGISSPGYMGGNYWMLTAKRLPFGPLTPNSLTLDERKFFSEVGEIMGVPKEVKLQQAVMDTIMWLWS